MSAPSARSTQALLLDRGLFTAVVLISFVILFAPSPPSPPLFTNADKLIHAGLFAALAWTGARAWTGVRAWRRYVPVVAGLVAYAVASEVIQATLLPRDGSWEDALADVTGAALGLLVAWLMARAPDRAGRR